MERERHRGLAELVRDAGPGLLRTAVLLTGDRASAEDLLLTALTRARSRWRAVRSADDPPAAVLELLVGSFLGRRRRLLGGDQVVEAAPAHTDADRAAAHARADALRTALLGLTPRARAALVLHLAEGLDATVTARLVRSDPDSVAGDVRGAVAQLRPLLHTAPGAAPPGPGSDAEELRARLHALADELTWLDPTVPAEEVTARARRQRRARAALAGAAVAVAALLVGVPAALGPAPPEATTATPSAGAPPPEETVAAVRAQLADAAARIGAAPRLTSPAEWDQWLPRGRPPQGTTGQADENTCPPLSGPLAAALDAPMGYWTGALPRGPVGCTWVPAPAPLSEGLPYDYAYVLSVGFVHDRDGTSIETLRTTFAPGGPGTRALCPAADLPGGGALIGCPDDDGDLGVRLLLAVRDARGVGVWVLSARVQPETGRSPAEALEVLVGEVAAVYG